MFLKASSLPPSQRALGAMDHKMVACTTITLFQSLSAVLVCVCVGGDFLLAWQSGEAVVVSLSNDKKMITALLHEGQKATFNSVESDRSLSNDLLPTPL